MSTDSFHIVDEDGGVNGFAQIVTLENITGLTYQESLRANGTLIAA